MDMLWSMAVGRSKKEPFFIDWPRYAEYMKPMPKEKQKAYSEQDIINMFRKKN